MDGGQHYGDDVRSTDEAAAKLACPSGEVVFATAETRYHTCQNCIFAKKGAKGKEDGKDGKRKADPRAIHAGSLFAKDRFGLVS